MKHFTRSGLVLKAYRHKLNMTQSEFGAAFGTEGGAHAQFVSNFERSLCLPPTPMMKRILAQKNFPKSDFIEALKEDLIESHMQKYQEPKRQKLKRAPKSKSIPSFGINV